MNHRRRYDRHVRKSLKHALKAQEHLYVAKFHLDHLEDEAMVDFVSDIEQYIELNEGWKDEQ